MNLLYDLFFLISRNNFLPYYRHFNSSLAYSINYHITIHSHLHSLFGGYLHWNVIGNDVFHRSLDENWNFFVHGHNLQLFFTQNNMARLVDCHAFLKSLCLIDQVLDYHRNFDVTSWSSKQLNYLFSIDAVEGKLFQKCLNSLLELEIQIMLTF